LGHNGPELEYNPQTGKFEEAKDIPDVVPIIDRTEKLDHNDIDPSDKNKLQGPADERTAAQQRKQDAQAADNKDAASRAHGEMCRASEELGEAATDIVVNQRMPTATPLRADLPGGQQSGQFDRIYKDGDHVYILESKGAGSGRGNRQTADGTKAEQGTPEYREDIIRNMEKKLETYMEDPRYGPDPAFTTHIDELADTISELTQAREAGKLDYGQVTQKVDGKGDLKPEIETTWFDPNRSKNVRSDE
jgi:hypothetical protein